MYSSRTVIIPLGASGAKGRAAYVHAGGARPANEARLIPEIALLNDCRLYPAGTIALSAVRRLGLRASSLALSQWLGAQPRPAYVSVSNAPELYGLTPENSASAQLGLALAMLMHQCQCPARVAVATGELAVDGLAGALEGARRDDVGVKPVGMLPQKFEAIGRLLVDYRGAALSSSLPFFFPRRIETGEETAVIYAEALSALTAVYQRQGVTLTLHPVSSLREAAAILGVERLPPSRLDRALAGVLFAAPLLAVMAGGGYWQATKRFHMDFASIGVAGGEEMKTPARIVREEGGGEAVAPVCKNSRGQAVYAVGDRLLLNVSGAGPHLALAIVSEHSGVKVFPPETWRNSQSDEEDGVTLPVNGVAEANMLIVLSQRLAPFDTKALRDRVAAAIDGKPPGERINAAMNSLVKEAPGYLQFAFFTVEGKPYCVNQ
jgi:hypothetical protein